jgi:CRP-like cAMP-binding protein
MNFIHFFVDEKIGFQADDGFVMGLLSKMTCIVFQKGEKIVGRQEKIDKLYFIIKGQVTVKSKERLGELL